MKISNEFEYYGGNILCYLDRLDVLVVGKFPLRLDKTRIAFGFIERWFYNLFYHHYTITINICCSHSICF